MYQHIILVKNYDEYMAPIWENWVGEFDESILPVYAYYDWVKYYSYTPGEGHMVVLIILALLGR